MCQPNKENLVFVGRWKTASGAIGIVKDNILTVEKCDPKCFIGLKFPIDSLGKCSVHSDFDLKERFPDKDRYVIGSV